MKVLELVGARVWIRCDRFRRISGIISSVPKPVSRDDLQSSIAESLFDIVLSSGEVVQLLGAEICNVDHNSEQVAQFLVERVGDFATSESGDTVLIAEPRAEVEEAVIGCLVLEQAS
jgi:hypothetical protein